MRKLLITFGLLAIVAACDMLPFVSSDPSSAEFTGVESGINGEVWMGPMVPVISADNFDQAYIPVEWDLEVFSLANGTTTEAKSSEDGSFRFPMPPGVYRISAKRVAVDTDRGPTIAAWPRADPVNTVVPADEWVTVRIDLDTGIR